MGSNPSTGSKGDFVKAISAVASVLKEFRAFALRANAVDLAIGVALGAAFTAVVQAIVSGLFTPLIAALFGKQNFSTLFFSVHGSRFSYGLVVNAVVTLLIVAIVLFFLVVKPLNALRRRLGLDTNASLPKAPCPACMTEIDLRARRCPSCTEDLGESWTDL
ncbi:MAG: large conductance mechanosensitive channel protein MscL [Acidimicrobiaceae bacterium]|nr:large conductance mechanosensitive channel protein MscL [Acidimicrobiaceae bacterium]